MSILAILATISGIVLGMASIPQAVKIFKTKSASDLSIVSYSIIELGSFIWILYGLELKNFAIFMPNILGFSINTIVLIGCYLYGKPKDQQR